MEFLQDYIGFVLLFLTTAFIMWYKRHTKDKFALTSKYLENRNYQVSYLQLIEAINAAMVKAEFKGVSMHPKSAAFTAQTKFSMSSWAEFIEVRCEQHQNNIAVNFLSICALPTQLYAWGKNRRNARKFFRELDLVLQNK
jgi:hypothetical protein